MFTVWAGNKWKMCNYFKIPLWNKKKVRVFRDKDKVRWYSGSRLQGFYEWVSGIVTSHGSRLLRWRVTPVPGESFVQIASRVDRNGDSSSWPFSHSGIFPSCSLIEGSRKGVLCSAVEAMHRSYSAEGRKSQSKKPVITVRQKRTRASFQMLCLVSRHVENIWSHYSNLLHGYNVLSFLSPVDSVFPLVINSSP